MEDSKNAGIVSSVGSLSISNLEGRVSRVETQVKELIGVLGPVCLRDDGPVKEEVENVEIECAELFRMINREAGRLERVSERLDILLNNIQV